MPIILTWLNCSEKKKEKLNPTDNTTKSNKMKKVLPDPKEKAKRVHVTLKANKAMANGAKENALNNLNNRILNPISNHVNHIASNPANGTVDTAKTKQTFEQNGIKIIDHDNRTLVEKLKDFRNSIR